jgi:hypothetical protein
MNFARSPGWHPARMTACSPGKKIKPGHVPAQDTLLTVLNQRVEHSVPGEKLPWIFLYP